MIDRNTRIRALSTKRRNVEQVTVDAVLEAMQPQPKPVIIPRAELRRQAEAAIAGFSGKITKGPPIDPATMTPRRHPMRRL